jgi:hypothetical protein
MARTTWAFLAAVLLLLPGGARAAEEAPAGTWKLTFAPPGRPPSTLWLVKLERDGEKWTGTITAVGEGVPKESTVEDVRVQGDKLSFTVKIPRQTLSFEGKVTKPDAKKILGSLGFGPQAIPAFLEATTLKSLESYEINKEILNKPDPGIEIFGAAIDLLQQAAAKKAKPEEVRGWAEKAFKAAEPHGARWQRELAFAFAQILMDQEGFASVAVEQARKAERLMDPTDKPSARLRVLNVLVKALKKAKKDDEAKEVEARSAKIDIGVKTESFAGRKSKSERVVLVELFTGAQCPPCVAADLAFDGLAKTYKPAEVVLLQYHLHIPGPDPLTNADTEARQKYYQVQGTPSIYFSGKPEVPGGGSFDEAPELYKKYRAVIDPMLEETTKIKLKVTAKRKGDKIDITGEVADLEKPSERIRLRFALVEEEVQYTGGNTLKTHHHVVRDLPGGAAGFALKEKTAKQTATVDLKALRAKLTKYLDDYAKEEEFPSKDRPLALKDLRVVAFVQNDQTKEVIEAAEVKVSAEEGAAEN